VAFLLGNWFGVWTERTRDKILDFSEALGRSFLLNQHALLQFCEADYEAAHEAMAAWFEYLQQLKPIDGRSGKYRDPLMNPRAIAVDKMMALGYLAIPEERRGQTDDAGQLWRRAEAEARTAEWKDPSELGIRAAVERLDDCKGRTTKR
jgi:Ser/Thr protein kinase RdoA (MazF antagonist)